MASPVLIFYHYVFFARYRTVVVIADWNYAARAWRGEFGGITPRG
jgi:hypothetical protein